MKLRTIIQRMQYPQPITHHLNRPAAATNRILLAAALLLPVLSADALQPKSGVRIDPQMLSAVFAEGPVHHQVIDAEASGVGAASVEELNAINGLSVNFNWAPEFERIDGRLGVSNYLHLRGESADKDRSIRFTTRYFSTGQSNWAGIGASGNADQGFMRVTGDNAWYLGSIGGSWEHAEIVMGRLPQLLDDPVGTRNESFVTTDNGVTYAVRAIGFILSRIAPDRAFTATIYNHADEEISVLTATAPGTDTAGDELFYGYIGVADDPATWVHRIVIRGNNAGSNAGLDNFAFSPIVAITAEGQIAVPKDSDTLHYWAFIEEAGSLPSAVVNYGNAALDGGPRFTDATLGGYATDGEGSLQIAGVDYGTVLSQSVVNLGESITGEAWFRWDLSWNYAGGSATPREVFLIHRRDTVAGNVFRFAIEDRPAGVDIYFDGSGVAGGRLLVERAPRVVSGISMVYGVRWDDNGTIESLNAYYSNDGGINFRDLRPLLGDGATANLGEIRVHAKGNFGIAGDWLKIHGIRVGASAQGVGLPELPVEVDPGTVLTDPPLWNRFANKSLVPGQAINSVASGPGVVNPADLEALPGFTVNTEWTGFLPISQTPVNYLYFTNNRAAFQFHIRDDAETGDEWAGVATHTDGLTVSGPAGPQERRSVYLGVGDENWGSYTLSIGSISAGMFYRTDSDGYPYAVQAAGFILANLLDGATVYADFYGIAGQLLATLEGSSATGAAESLDGDEVFFGYNAGDDPLNWISRIVIRGTNPGPFGFDDFGFAPVVSIAPDGRVIEAPSFIEDEVAVGGLLIDTPLYNTFATRNPLTAAGQAINRIAHGPGSRILEDNFVVAPLGVLTANYLVDGWLARVQRGVEQGLVSIVQESGNRFMRVLYPQGSLADGGGQWIADIGKADEATAAYRFRFESGYAFTEGGKLPGLSGGTRAVGGNPDPNGFTARYMWNQNGGIFLYLYHSEQPGIYGHGIGLGNARAIPGQWHHIQQRIVLNEPGEPNGILQVWFDGVMVLDRRDMRWRLAGANWDIDSFYFSTFHGGNSDGYRPPKNQYIDFDDFKIVPVDRSGMALDMEAMENLPGMRVNTDWIADGLRFAGKGNSVISYNALHFNDSNTGILFTLNHLGVGANPNSGATTSGLREMVTGPNAVYLAFVDESFVEYSLTMGTFDPGADVFRTADADGKPYVARAVGLVLSGINDRAEMLATFYNAAGDPLATLSGLGNADNGANGIEMFYAHDAGPDPANWIRKIVITGNNPNPYGGSRNVGLDDLGFTPITVQGTDPVLIPLWSVNEYPVDENGWREVAIGRIYDAWYPWIYQQLGAGWIYMDPESGLYSQYHYELATDTWLLGSELWGPYVWDFGQSSWLAQP